MVLGHVATGNDQRLFREGCPGNVRTTCGTATTLAMTEAGELCGSRDLKFYVAAETMSGICHCLNLPVVECGGTQYQLATTSAANRV